MAEPTRLLIKHAVGGRTFIDSSKTPMIYELVEKENAWRIDVQIEPSPMLNEILKWHNELNVFLFQESIQPVKKIWFYVKADGVEYDRASHVLSIKADRRLEYIPDEYTW